MRLRISQRKSQKSLLKRNIILFNFRGKNKLKAGKKTLVDLIKSKNNDVKSDKKKKEKSAIDEDEDAEVGKKSKKTQKSPEEKSAKSKKDVKNDDSGDGVLGKRKKTEQNSRQKIVQPPEPVVRALSLTKEFSFQEDDFEQ